jgi:hypothetical protein
VGNEKHALDGNSVGAGGFARGVVVPAGIGPNTGDIRVEAHGHFFAALGREITLVAEDGVDRNALWIARLADAAGVPAVETTGVEG